MDKAKSFIEKTQTGNFPCDEAVLVVMGFCKGRLSGAGCEGCPAKNEYAIKDGLCVFSGASAETVENTAKKILTEVYSR